MHLILYTYAGHTLLDTYMCVLPVRHRNAGGNPWKHEVTYAAELYFLVTGGCYNLWSLSLRPPLPPQTTRILMTTVAPSPEKGTTMMNVQ